MESKYCTKCKELKPFSEFHKSARLKDGRIGVCKKCCKEYKLSYNRTKKGLITKIYSKQMDVSRTRNHNPPDYSNDELKVWLFSKDKFHDLYKNWVSSGYQKDLSPSCDRLDDYLPYTFSNIQIVTWAENNQKGHDDRISGINNKQNKSVMQFTLEGIFVNRYHSMGEAERITKVNNGHICKCCRGYNGYSHAGGFVWCYA